jgi:signal transduction histidine kinase
VLVSLYPLAEFLAQQQYTRWQILGAGALVLIAGLFVSHLLAGRLSAPVEKLEIVSTENVVQRERAEAALEVSDQELRVRNAELQTALTELKATQQHVIQQERLRALGEMASGIAHDFNNALVPILGFAELLKMSPAALADREQATSYIDMIHTSAKDAASVVSRLRQFYRKQEDGEVFEAMSLEKLVKQSATLTRPRWKDQAQANGATIQVRLDLEPVPAIAGEEAALREVLTNLIFNAVDAMPDGGTITLRTRRQGEFAVLEVEDTGTGMTEEVRKRCLEPFFSTKGERGTGLGLSMVFGIVQRHGGSIDIRSEQGRGTTFVLTLPLHQDSVEKPAESDEASPQKPLRVLVVDDEAKVRTLLSAALTKDGHRVEMAEDGVAGLRCFRDGRFDVVLTDKAMPRMNGDQMACAIKQMAPGMPIILLTGFGQFLNKEDLPGVNVLLSKPVGIRTLREALVTALKAA